MRHWSTNCEKMAAAQETETGYDETEVVEFLAKVMPLPGLIKYRTEVDRGAQDTAQITLHKDLLLGLRGFKSHFTKHKLKAIIIKVAVDKEAEWHLAAEKPKFAEDTGSMLRAMLRDISQGIIKWKSKGTAKPQEWLSPFVEKDTIEPETQTDGQFMYKYDLEQRLAYRYQPAKPQHRQYCDEMVVDVPKEEALADVEARWSGGDSWKVPGLSVADFKAVQKTGGVPALPPLVAGEKKKQKDTPCEWEGNDKDGGSVQVKFSKAVDGKTKKEKRWIIIWHKPKDAAKSQRMQLVLNTLPDEDVKKAVEFTISLGKKFADTLMDKDEMTKEKKQFLAKLKPESKGSAKPSTAKRSLEEPSQAKPKKSMKRPAAAKAEPIEVEDDEEEDGDDREDDEAEDEFHNDQCIIPDHRGLMFASSQFDSF